MFGFIRKIFGERIDLRDKLSKGGVIIDVRTPREFSGGHIPGSKNIPLDKISSNLEKIKKLGKPIITCCASGMRSGSAKSILRKHGIEVYNGGSWSSLRKLV